MMPILWGPRLRSSNSTIAKSDHMPAAIRGDVWLVDLGYAAKVRPCLVLSVPPSESERALVTVVPHTTKPRGSRFEVDAPVSFLKPGVFDGQGLVTVPFPRLIRRLGRIAADSLVKVEVAVVLWLGIERDA